MFKFRSASKTWPCEAGSWNHRLAAVYEAAKDNAEHPMVKPVLERGLKAVKFLHHRVPPRVWEKFICTHNQFHTGPSASFREFLEEALGGRSGQSRTTYYTAEIPNTRRITRTL